MNPWLCPISSFTMRPVDTTPRRSAGRTGPAAGLGAAFRPAPRDWATALPARFSTTRPAAVTSAAAALGLGASLVDGEVSATNRRPVEGGDRVLRLLVRTHFDEAKSARAAGRLIAHDVHRLHGPGPREQLLQLVFTDFVRQVADIQLPTHGMTSSVAPRQ